MIVLFALALGASACAAILGIDDVTVTDESDGGLDASSDALSDGSLVDVNRDGDSAVEEYASMVIDDDAIGYYRLGDKDVNAVNSAISKLFGTYGDTITHTVGRGLITDPTDTAAIFPGLPDGSTQLQGVSIAKDPTWWEVDPGELTVEAWFEPLAKTGDNRPAVLVSYGTDIFAPFEAWALKSIPPNVGLYASCCGQILSKSPLTKGKVYHLVATFFHGGMSIYVNGVLDSDPGTGSSDLVFDASTDGLGIGASWHGDAPLNGILDEVAVYKKVLPPDRIQAHYQAGIK